MELSIMTFSHDFPMIFPWFPHDSYTFSWFFEDTPIFTAAPRNVVILGLRGLALSGQALEGPVLQTLKKGMEVLGYPKERAKELVNGFGAEAWLMENADGKWLMENPCPNPRKIIYGGTVSMEFPYLNDSEWWEDGL